MPKPNAEVVNDRFKRAHHRLVARALAHDPGLLEEARARVAPRPRSTPEPTWTTAWRDLLSRPLDEVRREITRPTERMTELRISSPFALTPTKVMSEDQRLRLWKKIRATTVAR
jgi:hypothetical protein